MKKSSKRTIIIAAVILALVALVVIKIMTDGETGPARATASGQQTVRADAIVIRPERLEHKILSTGTALADEEVELRAETGGRITAINFREGTRVGKGDLLLKINDSELQARLKKIELDIELAKEIEYRQRKLLEKEGISKEAYEKSLNTVNTLKAEKDLVLAQIDKTEIRAPFDGTIGLRRVSPGEYLSSGAEIARLVRIRPLKIEFSVPQKYSQKVHDGDTIKFRTSKDAQFSKARIYAIEPKIDPQTRMLAMRAIYDNRQGSILPGAYVDLELMLEELESALLVPSEAIVPGISGEYVFVYQNGMAVRRNVVPGIRTPKKVQIVEGLGEGDTLISSAIIQLRENMPVKLESVK
ncbi:MAG: efflux RND transporter periplasmic adaptor subunit [Candidatus Kapaibacterium sp.]